MKCAACKYDDEKNSERFICSEFKISYETDGNYYRNTHIDYVYICPKCGTLKIERW